MKKYIYIYIYIQTEVEGIKNYKIYIFYKVLLF